MKEKRKILFLDGNCQGRCWVDDGDGNIYKDIVYSLNSFTDSWGCTISKDDNITKEKFYSFFK